MRVSLRRRNPRQRSFQQWWSVALVIIAIAVQPLGAFAQISPLDGEPPIAESSVNAIDLDDPDVQAQINQYMIQHVDALVAETLEQMTVKDRAGQLFIVNFRGDSTGHDSDIASLIHEYRIGGVMLSPAYGNFSNQKNLDTPAQVASLSNRLQALAYGRVMPEQMALGVGDDGNIPADQLPLLVGGNGKTERLPLNIPLFIGVEQLGDDLALTSLRNGFTQLPNQLALGSTWDVELTRGLGEIVGRELAAVGVNLLIGPVLDILAQPRADGVGSLGVHTFGGDPFWGGQMGRAYISGVHSASEGRIATVARHFPGQGDVDRMPNEEVATIQSSADMLRRVALPPFTAITQPPGDEGEQIRPPSMTDGLMSSHMRYSAFQAVSNEHVPPLGFSRDLTSVLESEGFEEWRRRGGLLMSNALGLPAIRRDYDATLSDFPFRRAALDAFSAGNDLIYLGDLSLDGDWDAELANITEIVRFSQERYTSDPDFAIQVDAAVRRILRTKLLLYLDRDALTEQAIAAISATDASVTPSPGSIDPNDGKADDLAVNASPIPMERLFVTGNGLAILADESESRLEANALVHAVAGESISILYPDPQMVTGALPAAPQSDEQLLIFTDSRLFQECDACLAEAPVPPEEIAEIIIRLYGPDATAQMVEEQLASLTFSDLAEVLDAQAANEVENGAGMEATSSAGAEISTTEPISPPVELILQVPGEDKVSKIERQIYEAEWIIFAMLNVDPERHPNSDVVKRFLRERSGQLEDKNVIVLALQSPYFLDATEIGQLTSYLGVYSKSTPFLENTVRTLFRNFVPHGAPAVSVGGTRFSDLGARLAPDPDVSMPLSISSNDVDIVAGVEAPTVDAGDTIRIQVGPIPDYNGHPVPDGAKVDFRLKYEGTELVLPIEAAYTQGGVATRSVLLEYGGVLRVSASSGEATTGAPIALMVAETPARAGADDVMQPVQPAADQAPDQGATEIIDGALVTDSAAIDDASLGASSLLASTARVNLVTLIIALFTMIVMLSLLLIVQVGTLPRTTLVYNMLWAVIVGMIAYILYGLGLIPGSEWLHSQLSVGAAAVVVVVGMILPLLWLQLRVDSTM